MYESSMAVAQTVLAFYEQKKGLCEVAVPPAP